MSYECDGDCRATAEWRQQQIRDLTERAENAERERDRLMRRVFFLQGTEGVSAALGDAS